MAVAQRHRRIWNHRPQTGKYESIVELPGFTRGLSFCGPLAFIGLSQVRETAVFGGIPIAERDLENRTCGVWVVNIESGELIGFVKFEEAVQEIFAVEVLFGARYPELVNEDRELLAGSYELPDAALADVPRGAEKVMIPKLPSRGAG